VELVGNDDVVIDRKSFTVENNKWQKYTAELTSDKTVEKASCASSSRVPRP
jgi:hypothetical protein